MKYAKRKDGYRSGFEAVVAKNLERARVRFQYEAQKFKVRVPEHLRLCRGCGSRAIDREATYLIDFKLGDGWFIEAKGKLTSKNRSMLVAYRRMYPDHRFYLLFQRDNWLTKKKLMRYTGWAGKNGIICAVGTMPPKDWLK